MAWLDDRIRDHPKIRKTTPVAFQWWAFALAYSSAHGTGGFLDDAIEIMRIPRRVVDELVDVGLWDREPDGVWVHDWQEHNDKRDAVIDEKRTQARERQRRHREKVRSRDSHAMSQRDESVTVTRDGERDGPRGGARAGAGAPPREAGAAPNDHDHVKEQQQPAAPQERDQHAAAAIERLELAGWIDSQLDAAARTEGGIDRAIAWLDHCQADPTCTTPGGLAWTKYSSSTAWPERPRNGVAPGAQGTRSTAPPLPEREPEAEPEPAPPPADFLALAGRRTCGEPPAPPLNSGQIP